MSHDKVCFLKDVPRSRTCTRSAFARMAEASLRNSSTETASTASAEARLPPLLLPLLEAALGPGRPPAPARPGSGAVPASAAAACEDSALRSE